MQQIVFLIVIMGKKCTDFLRCRDFQCRRKIMCLPLIIATNKIFITLYSYVISILKLNLRPAVIVLLAPAGWWLRNTFLRTKTTRKAQMDLRASREQFITFSNSIATIAATILNGRTPSDNGKVREQQKAVIISCSCRVVPPGGQLYQQPAKLLRKTRQEASLQPSSRE